MSYVAVRVFEAPGPRHVPSYSSCCWRKTSALNCCWSFSLAKLMQSCSNEFVSKCSKPKMSRMPMNGEASFPSAWGAREEVSTGGGGRAGKRGRRVARRVHRLE